MGRLMRVILNYVGAILLGAAGGLGLAAFIVGAFVIIELAVHLALGGM